MAIGVFQSGDQIWRGVDQEMDQKWTKMANFDMGSIDSSSRDSKISPIVKITSFKNQNSPKKFKNSKIQKFKIPSQNAESINLIKSSTNFFFFNLTK